MAGETTAGSSVGTFVDGATHGAKESVYIDQAEFAVGELELADVKQFEILLMSSELVTEVALHSDDLDSDASPALVLDVGVAASQDFDSVTSGVVTHHLADDVLDSDLLVDGSTTAQAATTSFVSQVVASASDPANSQKRLWQALGYDRDPNTKFRVVVTAQVAAATAQAGTLAVRVKTLGM